MDELKTKILNSCEELNKQGVFKNSLDYEKCKESVQKSEKKIIIKKYTNLKLIKNLNKNF